MAPAADLEDLQLHAAVLAWPRAARQRHRRERRSVGERDCERDITLRVAKDTNPLVLRMEDSEALNEMENEIVSLFTKKYSQNENDFVRGNQEIYDLIISIE